MSNLRIPVAKTIIDVGASWRGIGEADAGQGDDVRF
jgi:hypothetical protein